MNRIFSYISIAAVIGFSLFMWGENLHTYQMLREQSMISCTNLDCSLRTLHFIKHHDPENTPVKYCPECYEYLRRQRQGFEPVSTCLKEDYLGFEAELDRLVKEGKINEKLLARYRKMYGYANKPFVR